MSWGPFLLGLDAAERLAPLRSLRALVRVLTGPRGAEAAMALLRAEMARGNVEAPAETEAEFDRLPSSYRRRVLSVFCDLHRPRLKVVHD